MSPEEIAKMVEFTEADAYEQIYEAAPPHAAEQLQLKVARFGSARARLMGELNFTLFNAVVGLGLAEPITEQMLDELVAFYEPYGVKFMVQISPLAQPSELSGWLMTRGFVLRDSWVKVYRGTEPPPEVTSPIEIRQVGAEQAEGFVETALKGFEIPSLPGLAEAFAAGVGRPGWRHYLGYDGDTPVSTGAIYVRDGVGWLGYGSTIASHRRLGAQNAVFARRIADGIQMGCQWFVTETDSDTPDRPSPSYRNMVRAGFIVRMTGLTTSGVPIRGDKGVLQMRRKTMLVPAITLVLASLLAWAPSYTFAQPSNCRTFTETGQTVCGKFLVYWDGHGGLAQQGYPISGELQETSQTDGKTYTVQYFERAIFEMHPENPPPNDVLLSLLGVFLYQSKYPGGAPNQQTNSDPGSLLFPETGKRVGGRFLSYWQSHGGLAQQGLPISDEFTETSSLDGKSYLVQYFERAVFEYHPEQTPEYQVLLSQLGTFRYREKYASPAPSPTAGSAIPTSTLPAVVPTDTPPAPPTATPAPQPTKPGGPPPLSCSAPAGQYCAAAEVSDPAPPPSGIETVTGRLMKDGQPVQGAAMSTIWHYKTTSSSCDSGVTGADGYATCGKSIGHPSNGYTVKIDVTFSVNGAVVARTQTEFTPQ